MAITAQQVNELRQITGAPMMDCKKALTETNGDIEAAIDFLRKHGQKVAAKRADRDANEGAVFAWTSEDGKEGIAFSFNCETEPVSKTAEFLALGKTILDEAAKQKPADAEAVRQMIINGRAVHEYITDLSGKIGEKIEVSRYASVKGEKVVAYIHGSSIAVLVNLANVGDAAVVDAGKDVAMQIAAMRPIAVDESSIPAEVIEREKEVAMDKARQEGKPENMVERIAMGAVKKFFQESTLLNQEFVKSSNKQTVAQYLNSVKAGLTVKSFERVSTGR